MGKLAKIALVLTWLIIVGGGLTWTIAHGNTPGAASDSPARWPAGAAAALDGTKATLLLFAHPRCPCTRASLHELAWILDRARGKVHAYVVFARPAGAPPGWQESDLRDAAAKLRDVTIVDDAGDLEAHTFRAKTSGQVVVYAPAGQLLFSGGITAERGHEGASEGRAAALAALTGPSALSDLRSFVFGCALDTPQVTP